MAPTTEFDRVPGTRFQLNGVLQDYLKNVTAQWLAIAPHANPGMLEMLRDRDRLPYRDLVPWAGEFFGKYLTGAVQVYRLTGDQSLLAYLKNFIDELLKLQDTDGYFGPWPRFARLTNSVPYPGRGPHRTWDTWSHYHAMLGLMLWHEETGDKRAFAAAKKIADLHCEKYLGAKSPRLCETGSTEMNHAPIHSLGMLYRKTGEKKYLDLATQICGEFAARNDKGHPYSGDYLLGPLSGLEFFELPLPRWESLHPILGMVELYRITGDVKYRQAVEQIWRSIARGDRHNNGGFSSGEQATGNPYDPAAIETCCTIAWMALSVEALKMLGDPTITDELELSLLNSITGMHSPSGRWATYNTPMDGVRIASAHAIVFQSREGTPELNCCSVNSVRGFGLLSEWAATSGPEGDLRVNYYGPGSVTLPLKKRTVTLTQETRYPYEPKTVISVNPSVSGEFAIHLRIPRWSKQTRLKVAGKAVKDVRPGTYHVIRRNWKKGDKIEVAFDFSLHFWKGKWDAEGKVSIYRGPLLLAYDRRYNDFDPDKIPAISPGKITLKKSSWKSWLPPQLLVEFTAPSGDTVRLCDFGSAGQGGTPYVTWLPMTPTTETVPQFFAPSDDDDRLLSLLRFRSQHQSFLGKLDQVRAGRPWITKAQLVTHAEKLASEWAGFEADVARARQHLATTQNDSAKPLAAALARLEKAGYLTEEFKSTIAKMPSSVRREFTQPISNDQFECSPLQPLGAIPQAFTPPNKGVAFSPVTTVTDEKFADVRKFHDGRDGLLYIRTNIRAKSDQDSMLVYGADGPFRVWLNGKEVGTHLEANNPAKIDGYKAAVKFEDGDNQVVIALATNRGNAWGVFVGRV